MYITGVSFVNIKFYMCSGFAQLIISLKNIFIKKNYENVAVGGYNYSFFLIYSFKLSIFLVEDLQWLQFSPVECSFMPGLYLNIPVGCRLINYKGLPNIRLSAIFLNEISLI